MRFIKGAVFGGIVVGSIAHFVGYMRGCFAGYALASYENPSETETK